MAEAERAPKKRKSMADSSSEGDFDDEKRPEPEATVDICDGDALIVANGLGGVQRPVGIRVSSHVVSVASPILKRLLASSQPSETDTKTLHLLEEDGDTLYLLLNILHLRNDALPDRLLPDAFFSLIGCAAKYTCLVAVSRAASQWLDHIYHNVSDAPLFRMAEVTYILNDATYFSRFTSRWVLETPLNQPISSIITANQPSLTTKRLAIELVARQKQGFNELKSDLDTLVEPLSEALADDNKHYTDCAPGDEPLQTELIVGPDGARIPPTHCIVDKEGATEFLSALRDDNLWPSTKWPDTTLQALIARIAKFKIPEYDASDQCYWCLHVEDTFVTAVEAVRRLHNERLWGMCLDCFKTGSGKREECRVKHGKKQTLTVCKGQRQVSGASVVPSLRTVSGASSHGTATALSGSGSG